MKKRITQVLMLAMMLLSSLCVQAQTIDELKAAAKDVAISDWSFSSSYYQVGDAYYKFDDTHNLAELYFLYGDKATEDYTFPETVERNGKTYIIVSIGGTSGYTQSQAVRVTIPETVRRLNTYALYGFDNVRTLVIPATVEQIVGNAFSGWTNRTLIFKGTTPPEVTGELSGSYHYLKIYVPAESFRTYHLADYIENHCVVADDLSVSTVSTGRVDNGELGYVVVADALPEVRTYSDVNKLIINAGTIDETDWYAIRQMKNLIYLDISGLSIREIPKEALYNCWQIERVILPDTLKAIRGNAFRSTGVSQLILPDSLCEITGGENFRNCDSLLSIIIPDSVKSLPGDCFRGCDNLHQVKLPSMLATMGGSCFYECDLYDIDIPGTLATIPSSAFAYNRNMTAAGFGDGIQTIGSSAFYQCSSLQAIQLPPSVRTIKDNAFSYCSQMATIGLNEGLETINDYAFYSCRALTEVTLPSSLQYCLYYPFNDCPNIVKIESRALIPPTVRNNVPTYTARNIDLYVPLWSFQEYMTTPGWLEYQDHTHINADILPENIVINKDFEFVLKEEQNVADYKPNMHLLYNTEEIDDGFGHTKYERGNLTVSSQSKLNVNDFSMYVSPFAKYYADDSRFYSYQSYTYDNWRTIYNPNSLVVKSENGMRAETQTYHMMLRNDLWQFISFPFDINLTDIVPDDAKTQWVIRSYSGEERAAKNFDNTWQDVTTMLEAGKGYIMKCYNNETNNNTPVFFTLKPVDESVNKQNLFKATDRSVALTKYESEFESDRSWNLVGNPYPSYFDTRYLDTESPFLVWNSYNKSYVALSPIDDDYILNPSEAFFIQKPVEQDDADGLLFLKGGRQTYRNPNDLTVTEAPRKAQAKAQRHVINLTLSDGTMTDRTRVVYNDEATLKYEVGRDAAKFLAENAAMPQLWSQGGSTRYAINERPSADGTVELSVRTGMEGLYTIGLAENSAEGSYILTDRLMGTKQQLSAEQGYTFAAEAGETMTGRFVLTAAVGDATGIDDHNSEFIIQNSGHIYDLQGREIENGKSHKGLFIVNGKKVVK